MLFLLFKLCDANDDGYITPRDLVKRLNSDKSLAAACLDGGDTHAAAGRMVSCVEATLQAAASSRKQMGVAAGADSMTASNGRLELPEFMRFFGKIMPLEFAQQAVQPGTAASEPAAVCLTVEERSSAPPSPPMRAPVAAALAAPTDTAATADCPGAAARASGIDVTGSDDASEYGSAVSGPRSRLSSYYGASRPSGGATGAFSCRPRSTTPVISHRITCLHSVGPATEGTGPPHRSCHTVIIRRLHSVAFPRFAG